jgi:hypothetical protein
MIPLLNPYLRIVGGNDIIVNEFHRWLQVIARTVSSTYIADQIPLGGVAAKDGQFAIHAKRLTLTGSDRATLEGSARLVICG